MGTQLDTLVKSIRCIILATQKLINNTIRKRKCNKNESERKRDSLKCFAYNIVYLSSCEVQMWMYVEVI